jgi:hypothetical protein
MKQNILFMVGLFSAVVVLGDNWDNGDDTGAGATPLTISTNLMTHGPHTVSNSIADPADWFSFYLEAGKRYRIESTGLSDTTGNLYFDSAGSSEVDYQVDQVQDAGSNSNFKVLYTPSISQTYYLRVNGQFAANEASYDLLYLNEPIQDEWDPGDDTFATAPLLFIDGTEKLHGEHKLDRLDEYDWFKFNLISGIEYTFESISKWDTQDALFNTNMVQQNSTNGDDDDGIDLNFKTVYTPSESGLYYLRINAYNDTGFPDDIVYSLKYYISSNPDADSDGMPDAWEIEHFGNTHQLASGHGDADIFTNYEEYIAGTDPADETSYFAITNAHVGSFIIQWPSIAERYYSVLWSSNLTAGFTALTNQLEHPQNSYTDTVHNAEESGFYKVDVQLIP